MKHHAQKQSIPLHVSVTTCAFEIKFNPETREIQVFPAGPFRARDGRPEEVAHWIINRGIAGKIIAQLSARKTPVLIDYEHQTLRAKENGKEAPASGWFDNLGFEWREGEGLFAVNVNWTDRALAYLKSDEYKFFSPVFSYNKNTGEVLDLFMGALTNNPAIDGMDAVAAVAAANFSLNLQEDKPMDPELLALLGLKEGASEEEIQQAIVALKTRLDNVTELQGRLDDETKAKQEAETALAAATAEHGSSKPDPQKYVPIDVMKDLQTQVADLSSRLNTNETDMLVEAALKEGKLLPAQEPWARDLARTNIAALKAYLDGAQPIAALVQKQAEQKKQQGANGALDEEQLAVCTAMGLDPEEYKKTLDAEKQQSAA